VYNSAPGSAEISESGVLTTVLVVEEQFVSEFLRSVLSKRGYRVVCAGFERAKSILRQGPEPVDLVITNKPLEFVATPDVPILYVAACPDPEMIRGFGRALALSKPFHPRDLLECLRRLAG
jgi:DNA-binding response OmpR family regulator